MKKLEMKKILFLIVLLVVSGFVFAYSQSIPNPGHGADEVFISVNGNKVDLQSAINSGVFSGNYVGNGNHGSVASGHSDNIFVNVGGVNKNLQTAIDDGSLCSSGNGGSGQYSGENKMGHDASKIWVNFNGEKTLQAAINAGLFGKPRASYSCSGGDVYYYDGCGNKGALKEDCPSSYSCSGNACVAPCTSHTSASCYGGDVYWYDSCGNREGVRSDCTSSQTCSSGACVAKCVPSCSGKNCGGDGCGGSCGTCSSSQTCSSGVCVAKCLPAGTLLGYSCTSNPKFFCGYSGSMTSYTDCCSGKYEMTCPYGEGNAVGPWYDSCPYTNLAKFISVYTVNPTTVKSACI